MVDTQVVGDDLHPGAEAAVTGAAVEALVGTDERGLRDFVGLADVAQLAGARAADGWVVTTEQLGERIRIAVLGGENQHGVGFDVVW